MTLWWLMVVMTHWWLLYQQVQKQDNRGQRRPPYMKPIQNNPEQLLYDFYMGRFKSVERAMFIFPIPVCKVGWWTLWHESESGMYLESCAKSVERARADTFPVCKVQVQVQGDQWTGLVKEVPGELCKECWESKGWQDLVSSPLGCCSGWSYLVVSQHCCLLSWLSFIMAAIVTRNDNLPHVCGWSMITDHWPHLVMAAVQGKNVISILTKEGKEGGQLKENSVDHDAGCLGGNSLCW